MEEAAVLKVQIITEAPGWILRAISDKIIKYNSHPDVKFSYVPQLVKFYVDAYRGGKYGVLNVGLFTHPHDGTWESIPNNVFELDFIIHMAKRYYDMFLEHGIPANKMTHLIVPIELEKFPIKKICLGYSGRMGAMKGHEVLRELINNYNLTGFRFKWVGPNLDEFHNLCIGKGIESKLVKCQYEKYPGEYLEFDYLLVPSKAEGGPLSILEALAMGIPVISSDVGIAPEVAADYIYPPGDVEALYNILKIIGETELSPRKVRRRLVENFTWESFTYALGEIFLSLDKGKLGC